MLLVHRDNAKVAGLMPEEAVVLSARPRSPSQQKRLGFSGSWTPKPSKLDNSYFKLLLEQDWKVGCLSFTCLISRLPLHDGRGSAAMWQPIWVYVGVQGCCAGCSGRQARASTAFFPAYLVTHYSSCGLCWLLQLLASSTLTNNLPCCRVLGLCRSPKLRQVKWSTLQQSTASSCT